MLGTDLSEWAAELAADTGLSVEIEPRDLVLPAVLVSPGPINFDRLDAGTASTDIELMLIAGDSNTRTALDELTHMLLTLRRHFGNAPATAEPMSVKLPSQSPDPLPALRCPINTEIQFTEGATS